MNTQKIVFIISSLVLLLNYQAHSAKLDESQQKWFKKYHGHKKQKNLTAPDKMLVNQDAEPGLTDKSFKNMFNGKDIQGWNVKGGTATFEVKDGEILGKCDPKSKQNTFLCTDRTDYKDFIFTCEMKWEEDGNSGIMFRAILSDKGVVSGPQCEMEGWASGRGWSGGIYGEKVGGWYYPLWLEEHKEARKALIEGQWNRVTIMAKGDVMKTWINGVPAAHFVTDKYKQGYFGLQVHTGKTGILKWRNIKVKEL